MKCTRKGTNERIKERLAKHAARTAELVLQGMSKAEASQKAYDEITKEAR